MHQKWWVLTAVACGTFMATLDSSIVNIALPTLTADLETSVTRIKWVVVTYFLVITCLLLPFGRLSDSFGRKQSFLLGFFIFTIASALCGLSPNLITLVIFRTVQAVGAALLMANGPAIVTSTFPITERGASLGKLAMVVSLGLITGPALGGWLISELGWRSIFLINIPFGLIGLGLAFLYVKDTKMETSPNAPAVSVLRQFDWWGSILQSIFLLALIVIFEPPETEFHDLFGIPYARFFLIFLCVLTGIAFIRVEKKTEQPVFDLSLMKNRSFLVANVSSFFFFVAYSSFAVLVPYFFEHTLKLSTSRSGQLMTFIPVIIFIVAPISGRLSDYFGSKELCLLGAGINTIALSMMAGIIGTGVSTEMSELSIILGLSAVGLAVGLFQSPNNNTVMSSVSFEKLSVASALIAMIRNLGLFIGVGIGTSLFAWKGQTSGDMIKALHFSFASGAFFAALTILATLAKERGAHWKIHAEDSPK